MTTAMVGCSRCGGSGRISQACLACGGTGVRSVPRAFPVFRFGALSVFDARLVPVPCGGCQDGSVPSACPACDPGHDDPPGTEGVPGRAHADDRPRRHLLKPRAEAALLLIVMVALVFGGLLALAYPKFEPACGTQPQLAHVCSDQGRQV